MNKTLILCGALLSLAACETYTGEKSKCFGQKKPDGDYSLAPQVSRANTNALSFTALSATAESNDNGCDFQSF